MVIVYIFAAIFASALSAGFIFHLTGSLLIGIASSPIAGSLIVLILAALYCVPDWWQSYRRRARIGAGYHA